MRARLADLEAAKKTAFGTVASDEVKRALEALGVSAQDAEVKITTAGQKIIDNFNIVATAGEASAGQIKAAFFKAVEAAETVTEVEKLKEALLVAFKAGKLSAEEFAQSETLVTEALTRIKDKSVVVAGGFKFAH